MPLPADLPALSSARLPASYEAATAALAECSRVDECQEWANRAEALASYGRQANDDALMKMAMRIKARAIDRCGELLREIPASKGGRPPETKAGPDLSLPSEFLVEGIRQIEGRYAAGHAANMTTGQIKTALRVNAIPREQFEAMVESADPPTVTQLATIGKRSRPAMPVIDVLGGRDPGDFQQATRLLGVVSSLDSEKAKIDIPAAIRGLNEAERNTVAIGLGKLKAWTEEVSSALQPERPSPRDTGHDSG